MEDFENRLGEVYMNYDTLEMLKNDNTTNEDILNIFTSELEYPENLTQNLISLDKSYLKSIIMRIKLKINKNHSNNDIKSDLLTYNKTIEPLLEKLLVTSFGPDIIEVENIREKVIDQLSVLSKDYNIIIRLHPLQKHIKMGKFKIVPDNLFSAFMKFVEISDIIIGPPSAVLCASTIFYDKKIICYSPIHNKEKYLELLGKNIDYVLNEKNCVMTYGDNIDLIDAVNKSIINHDKLSKERRKYVNFMFKCINGYENIQTIINILKYVKNLDFKSNIKFNECFNNLN